MNNRISFVAIALLLMTSFAVNAIADGDEKPWIVFEFDNDTVPGITKLKLREVVLDEENPKNQKMVWQVEEPKDPEFHFVWINSRFNPCGELLSIQECEKIYDLPPAADLPNALFEVYFNRNDLIDFVDPQLEVRFFMREGISRTTRGYSTKVTIPIELLQGHIPFSFTSHFQYENNHADRNHLAKVETSVGNYYLKKAVKSEESDIYNLLFEVQKNSRVEYAIGKEAEVNLLKVTPTVFYCTGTDNCKPCETFVSHEVKLHDEKYIQLFVIPASYSKVQSSSRLDIKFKTLFSYAHPIKGDIEAFDESVMTIDLNDLVE